MTALPTKEEREMVIMEINKRVSSRVPGELGERQIAFITWFDNRECTLPGVVQCVDVKLKY